VTLLEFLRNPPRILSGFLLGISWLFCAGVRLRHVLYDRGYLQVHRVPLLVVSVGNIACGGTGKTPLVQLLAKRLSSYKRVAILTRGYGGRAEKGSDTLVIRCTKPLSFEECGDEPCLLARSLPEVALYVGRDRIAAAKRAREAGEELLILDDGMQHRRLHRDFELVVLDGRDPFGGGRFLPRGLLRETPRRLRAADAVFLNHVSGEKEFERLREALKPLTGAPLIGMGYRVEQRGRKERVGLFCALGRPERFAEGVEERGDEEVGRYFILDHRPFDLKQLERFAQRCLAQGAVKLLCTEKDFVKLPERLKLSLPVETVSSEVEIRFGKEYFEELIQRIAR